MGKLLCFQYQALSCDILLDTSIEQNVQKIIIVSYLKYEGFYDL